MAGGGALLMGVSNDDMEDEDDEEGMEFIVILAKNTAINDANT